MKYFIIEIQTLTDGTQAQSITEKNSMDEAIAAFYYAMSYAMSTDLVKHICCMAVNDQGGIYKSETWTRITPEAEEEE